MPPNNRLWSVVLLLVGAIITIVGTVVQREIDQLSARLDRVTEFILDKLGK